MAQPAFTLLIYGLNQPLLTTEWVSMLGDKFSQALPFQFLLTDDISAAHVVAWDGVISPKLERIIPEIEKHLATKILLFMGESQTLLRDHPIVRLYQGNPERTFQLTGWSVLPEEILAMLETCYQKIQHV
jgi:hypothetical protein